SADKSVSIAWAFAPSEAERALIMGAHRDAVDAATEYAAGQIGRARKGHGGRDGWEYGAVTWLAFEHHAARPTIEVARVDSHGQAYTERLTLKVTGDPQLHTHRVLPNVTLSRSGRVGGLHLGRLEGRVHEIGAYYQAQLATHLRRAGIPTLLDPETGAAYIPGIPRSVREAFSKRTREASHAAREYAAKHGLAWDAMAPEAKVDLIKTGAAITREGKDGVAREISDLDAWHEQAEAMGWRHASTVRASTAHEPPPQEPRIDRAYAAGQDWLAREFERRAVVSDEDARVAALRGLIESGITGPRDINAVTAAFRERGISQRGQHTSLAWAPN